MMNYGGFFLYNYKEEKMIKKAFNIDNIPAILWGEDSSNFLIAVHGNQSSKADVPISILAEEAGARGYQVLSFDLPQHGERKGEERLCKVQYCVEELIKIREFAQKRATTISIFACSMGAYFTLLAYKDMPLERCLFLSPVLNMESIIQNMMTWFDVSEERLQNEQEIATPIGEVLYWDYYSYVKTNPILYWNAPTSILYGEKDELCEWEYVEAFAKKFQSRLEIVPNASHYFQTTEQLETYRNWLKTLL